MDSYMIFIKKLYLRFDYILCGGVWKWEGDESTITLKTKYYFYIYQDINFHAIKNIFL